MTTDDVPGPSQPNKLQSVADRQIDKLISASRWHRVWIAVLLVVCVALGYVAYQNRQDSAQLKADSISSCESGNATRAQQTQVWEKNYALQASESKATASLLAQLISAVAQGNASVIKQIDTIVAQSSAASAAETQTFLNYVKQVNAPKNCAAEYSNVTSTPPKANQDVHGEESTTAVTSETAELLSWDGACLTIATAAAGTPVTQTSCAAAHAWTYYSTGELTPQGHSNVEVGDSGGNFVLKAVPTGTDVYTNSEEAGPGGYDYSQLYFGVGGTYWHANGSGQTVTFDSTSGDHANYWAILSDNAGGKGPHQAIVFNLTPHVS